MHQFAFQKRGNPIAFWRTRIPSFHRCPYTMIIPQRRGFLNGCFSSSLHTIRYGIVARHDGKDVDHNLTQGNWLDLCDAITCPFAITKHGEGYRLFTDVKVNDRWCAVGVDVKNIGKGMEINSIKNRFWV